MKKILLLSILVFLLVGFSLAFAGESELKIITLPVEKSATQNELKLNFTIENLGEEKNNVTIKLLSISDYSDFGPFEVKDSEIRIDKLLKNEKKTLFFDLFLKEAPSKDEYNFISKINYSIGELTKEYYTVINLSFTTKGGQVTFTAQPNLKVGFETLIALSSTIKNNGTTEVKDITIKLKENEYFSEYMQGKNVYLASLAAGKSATFTLRIKPHEKITSGTYETFLILSYKDANGNQYMYEQPATITIAASSFTYFVRRILDYLYGLIPNYGIAIIILTLLIKLILLPITIQQLRSMSKTQAITPELKAIQEKYKSDPKKAQEEQMKLYKKYGINPATGCIVSILPLPILLILFSSLNGYVKLLDQSFLWVKNLAAPDPTYIIPILVAATTLLQQYITTGKDPSAKVFMFMFPILIGYWALSFPSAISIYWIFYSIFSTVEYVFVNRRYAKALEQIKK
ncbi:MAG: membrane protein insertase YidC [Caldisericia bacterium]